MVLYNYLADIENNDRFKFIIVAIISLYFATVLFPIDIRHIAGILIGVFFIFLLNDTNLSTITDFNRETEAKLNAIKNATRTTPRIGGVNPNFGETDPSISRDVRTQLLTEKSRSTSAVSGYVPKYLHIDVDLINYLFNILDFREYNPNSFLEIVESIDNILKIREDVTIGVQQCAENMEVANQFKNLALNHMQSFIYSLPSSKVINNKMKRNINRLQLILRRHIDEIYRKCKKQERENGLNYRSRPLYNSGPRPNDLNAPDTMLNFDIYT